MMFSWLKGEDCYLSRNFISNEFQCPCHCDNQSADSGLIDKLQALRDMIGPIHVTSGYRCEVYQSFLKSRGFETAKGISSHTLGLAADIHITGDRETFLKHVHSLFDNVGEASTWVHVDIRPGGPRRWTYKS